MKKYWFTWERQRRNVELSRALSCEYFEFNYDDRCQAIRYLLSIYKTVVTIINGKPNVVFGQHPSLVLVVVLVLFRKLFCYKLIVDVHNAGIFPCEGKYKVLNYLVGRINREADLLLVTNEELKKIVERQGGKAFVLQDKTPDMCFKEKKKLEGKINILFICKFHNDEPYLEVFRAARMLPNDIFIYVTGNYEKLSKEIIRTLPTNIKLIGFVPEDEYGTMVNSVDAVMDLTMRENCLLCGAYEALGAEKPIILSNNKALVEYFCMGTIFVDNTPEQIKLGIEEFVDNKDIYCRDIVLCKDLVGVKWERKLHELTVLLKT